VPSGKGGRDGVVAYFKVPFCRSLAVSAVPKVSGCPAFRPNVK
jgi:hypothetical protein